MAQGLYGGQNPYANEVANQAWQGTDGAQNTWVGTGTRLATGTSVVAAGTALGLGGLDTFAGTTLGDTPLTDLPGQIPVDAPRLGLFAGGILSGLLFTPNAYSGLEPISTAENEIPVGTDVTRNFGGESDLYGHSWTSDPVSTQTRDNLGLPAGNTARFQAHGTIIDNDGIMARRALPIPEDGVAGGGELLVPSPSSQIQLNAVTMPDDPL